MCPLADEASRAIGVRIAKLRDAFHYSRKELAEYADISENFLIEIENGKKRMSAATVAKLSVALHVSTDYILFGVEKDHALVHEILADYGPAELDRLEALFIEASKILDKLKR